MLTHRQKSVLDFIQREQRDKGLTPSTREIQVIFILQPNFGDAVHRRARTKRISPTSRRQSARIDHAGSKSPNHRCADLWPNPGGHVRGSEQDIEGHVSLDARSANVSRNHGTFALRVRGDSMVGAHILDGDIVILEQSKDVHNGDIVAALIDGETTLKRYVVDHGRPYLKAENPRYPNLIPRARTKNSSVMVSLVRKHERRKK